MNLTALQTALKRYGFDDTDPLTTWLNAGMRQFVDSYQWPFMETQMTPRLTALTATLNLPVADTTFRKVRTVAIADTTFTPKYQKLLYWEAHRFDRVLDDPTVTGIPQIYTLTGLTTMTFWPIPVGTPRMLIRFIRGAPDLVSAGDIPIVPVEYHYTIVRAAAVIALMAENEEERAQSAKDEYEGDLQSAIEFYSTHEDDDAAVVEDEQGYGDG